LVRCVKSKIDPQPQGGVGLVLEIVYSKETIPDYRTPPSILVKFSEPAVIDGRVFMHKGALGPKWYYKGELEVINLM
jgi:hypothetical protein